MELKYKVQTLTNFMVKYFTMNVVYGLKERGSAVAAKTLDGNASIVLELYGMILNMSTSILAMSRIMMTHYARDEVKLFL
jgi:hypothetical protein